MSADERLYHLLPAVYRLRDADQRQVLRALLAVIEAEHDAVHDNIASLYDDWFIETCAEWVVPYIGDLLGVRPLRDPGGAGAFTLRPYVANTLAYRRRKGTVAALEQLARDVTNRPAHAVEFFQLLGWNQNLNHPRPAATFCPDLRDMDAMDLIGGPFERASHTVEVRRIASGRGRYDIANVGLFLWRLQDYSIVRSDAAAAADPPDGRHSFSPLGNSAPLFNRPRTRPRFARVAAESDVPAPLRRRRLHEELEALRQAVVDGATPAAAAASAVYFGDPPVVRVVADGADIPPLKTMICNLEAWRRPPAAKLYQPSNGGPKVPMPIGVAVDPALGRIAFPAGAVPASVVVDYVYGFSADLGGGPYDRRQAPRPAAQPAPADPDTVADPAANGGALIAVSSSPGSTIATIAQALAKWDPSKATVIQIEDSRTYREDVTIAIPAAARRLVLQAANLQRPTILGSITVTGGTGAERLALNGLLIGGGTFRGAVVEGDVTIQGKLAEVEISHCTVVPGRRLDQDGVPQEPNQASLTVTGTNDQLQVVVDHSILGPLRLPATLPGVTVRDSILDGGPLGEPTIAADNAGAAGPPARLERTTSLGPMHVTDLVLGSEVIFGGVVTADRRQDGCVRFSYVPDGSRTPRRFECQPDLALARRKQELGLGPSDTLPPAERAAVLARVRPEFTAVRYGDPAYAQLSLACAVEIATGAEDGAEMGAYASLQQPQRAANLRAVLEEYLPFGLEAGIFYVT